VVHGYLIDHGYEGFTFFEMGIIGYPIMIVGVLILVFGISHLLPDRKDVMVELDETTRDFVAALKVTDKYRYIGATVENAGLRHLQGLFLFQIERDGERITPVKPDEHILEGDRLFFTGVPSTIVELQKENGLEIINDPDIDLKNYDSNKSKIFEVVVSNGSRLIGKKVKNSNFREMFDAVIIAIHRHGERVESKVGDIRLAAGDTLLVLAPNNFLDKWYNSREFLLVSQSKDVPSRPLWQKIFIISVLGLMILLVTTGIYPMIVGSSLAAAVLMVSRSVTMQDAFKAINWKVLLIIASAFGISEALVNVGISSILAEQIVSLGLTMGEWGVIFLLAGMTLVYSEMVTNSAAAAIIIPLIVVIAEQTGISVHALALSVVFGATISFATPISYQTNTMVQGPGNYKFTDYLKAGIPLDIIMLFSVSTLIYFLIL
jgi:di/tricarboxylate transporter